MPSTINVTACDNELVIVAYQPNASYVLCNIESGFNNAVNVTLNLTPGNFTQTVVLDGLGGPLNVTQPIALPAGSYSLLLLGINWQTGSYQFLATVNGTTYGQNTVQQGASGLDWNSAPIAITV